MKVHGLIKVTEGIKVCYAEHAFYTLDVASGRWVCTDIGKTITQEQYDRQIKGTVQGAYEGDLDLDDMLKCNISLG